MAKKIAFKLGELFCGPGGLAYGALKARSDDGKYYVKHAWANDYDRDTCITYTVNICPETPDTVYGGDVRDLPIKELGRIDAFAYGFPCNSFSNVGEYDLYCGWPKRYSCFLCCASEWRGNICNLSKGRYESYEAGRANAS